MDILAPLLSLIALVLVIIMVIAQLQLFAIRRLLETLVKQGAGEPISDVVAQPPAETPTRGNLALLAFIVIALVGIALLFASSHH